MHKLLQKYLLFLTLFLAACAAPVMIQPQVNSLVIAQKYPNALTLLESGQENYGPNNKLLYLMDYGLVLHYAKDYQKSINAFEQAKSLYDQLYTQSIIKESATWFLTEESSEYRG